MTRALMVGAGAIARAWLHALALQPELELVGVVDPRAEVARATLTAAGVDTPIFDTLDEGLRSSELVVNLTPPAVHRSVATAAIDAGLDVITEKPLAPTLVDAAAMVDAAERAGRGLWVMQNRRFAPELDALRAGIERGELGRLSILTAELWMSPRHSNTYLSRLPHPLLQDTVIHSLDLALTLVPSRPRRVFCHAFAPIGSWHPGTGATVCIVEFDSGVVFEFRGSWAAPGFATGYDGSWRVVGTGGTALWDGVAAPRFQPTAQMRSGDEPGGRWVEWPAMPGERGHPAALQAILRERAGGPPSGLTGRANLPTIAVLEAAVRSADAGGWIEVRVA